MNLKQKLSQLLPKAPPAERPTDTIHVLPSGSGYRDHQNTMKRIEERLRQIPPGDVKIPFDILENWQKHSMPKGKSYEKVTRRNPTDSHGCIQLNLSQERKADLLAPLVNESRLEGFSLQDALFLDIEATGLSHGTGTFAFMIGLGHFEKEGSFVVRQLVLKDPSEELPFLQRFKQILDKAKYLVSFNGKSYDLSVLQTRLILHRLYSPEESEIKLTPHLDLLHIHRTLWKGVLPDCRLQTLERELLHFHREDDVPGEMVPSLYFHFLATNDARALLPVLEHNEFDMVSMAALVANLLHLVAQPNLIPDDNVVAALGDLYLKRGNPHDAILLLEKAISGTLQQEILRKAFQSNIKAHKRMGRHTRLYPVIQEYVDRFPADQIAWTELAMHYEHRMKDYPKALECAEMSASLIKPGPGPDRDAVEKRLKRLERWRAAPHSRQGGSQPSNGSARAQRKP